MVKITRLLALVFLFFLQTSVYWIKKIHAAPLNESTTPHTVSCTSSTNSCRDKSRCITKLDSQYGQTQPKCYCDQQCSALNDCCSDYITSCSPSNQRNTKSNPDHRAFQPHNWKCFQFSKLPRTPGIWMVDSCPVNFTDSNNTKRKCEAGADLPVTSQTKDLLSGVPVSSCSGSTCVTFRNVHCAKCNGMYDYFNAPLFWDITWRCNIRPPNYLTRDQKTRFLLENCPDYHLNPSKDSKIRYCYPVVSSCKVSTNSTNVTNDCAQGPVSLIYRIKNNQIEHYKNPKCLLCNGGDLGNASCGPAEFSMPVFQPKSFEMVLQFQSIPGVMIRPVTAIKPLCGQHQFYDASLEECREGILPDPSRSIVDTFRFKAWLARRSKNPGNAKGSVLMSALVKEVGLSTNGITLVSNEIDEKSQAVTFDVQTVPYGKSNSSSSILGIKRLLDFKKPFNISTDGNRMWEVIKITYRRLTCSRPKIYPPSNFTRNNTHFNINNNIIIHADASDVHVITQNHSKYGVAVGSLFLCKSFYATACEPGQILLQLQSRDYLMHNGTLLFVAANTRYDSGQFELQGNSAWVCTNYTNTTPTEPVVPWVSKFGNNQVLWYFTVCGLSLSIACLFALLVTYFTFKELRTMPGKNLMSLAISLLLCHFIWLLGSGDTDKPIFCRVIAVFLHYLFLVSFACTSVIAYDTRRAFPKNSADMSNILFPAASKARFIAYLLFSWGVPLVFVVICVVIDHQGEVFIGYGNAVICWLTDMKAQILFFGVPIGLLLLYNLVAFVVTVQAIRAAKLGSKHLHRQGTNRSHEIKIYFRLMTIMGFTWFFGFGAHALHKFLMYPFVILTSLHGVYLAFAFAFKPYVLNLYRNRFANLKFPNRKSTLSTVDLTISMKSMPSKETESVL